MRTPLAATGTMSGVSLLFRCVCVCVSVEKPFTLSRFCELVTFFFRDEKVTALDEEGGPYFNQVFNRPF